MAQNYKLYRIFHTGRQLFMQDLKTLTIQEFHDALKKAGKIIIIPHKNPDGDAIGSSLGLFHYLTEKGKTCQIAVNDAVPEFLGFLPDVSKILNYQKEPNACAEEIKDAEMIICADYGQLYRTGELQPLIEASSAIKMVIDHHPDPDPQFNFTYHQLKASSTSELVYLLIQELEPGYAVSKNMANCLYTGLLTDTGCFKHALRPDTFRVAGELLKTGISYELIVSQIFDSNTPERLHLIGFALNEKLVYLPEYRTAFISISYEESEALGLKKGETEGLVNYALSITNTVMGAFFHEREKGKTKISLRSKGNFAVNSISGQYFSGGGHKNAAGGEFEGSSADAVNLFKEILPQYKAELTSLVIGIRD